MRAHTAHGVGQDHGIDAGGFEHALGQFRFALRSEGLRQNELAVIHGVIIRLDAITNLDVHFDPREVRPTGPKGWASQNRGDSRYNSPLGLRG